MACQTTDPMTGMLKPGCVIDVTVRPPPGLDIALLSATPTSSVAVLHPAAPPTHQAPPIPRLSVRF
jgi:hypothetical protein